MGRTFDSRQPTIDFRLLLDVRRSAGRIETAARDINSARQYDLQDRLIDLSVCVSKVCDSLPSTRVGKHVAGQLLRCGTAPAPLHAEASAAESRRDFIHKLGLCLKELRETMTWLRYLDRLGIGDEAALDESIRETDRAIAIVYSSIRTAKRNDRSKS